MGWLNKKKQSCYHDIKTNENSFPVNERNMELRNVSNTTM